MRYRFQHRDQLFDISIERKDNRSVATINGQTYEFEVLDNQPGQLSLRFAGQPVLLSWAADGARKWVSINGCTYLIEKPSTRSHTHEADGSGGEMVRSPMPAQVRAVQVAEGDAVEKGQVLLLLEAMKMEIRIKAPSNGHVSRLAVQQGQAVEKEQLLAEIGG